MRAEITVITPDGHITMWEAFDVPPIEQYEKWLGGPPEIVPGFSQREGNRCVAFVNRLGAANKLPFNEIATELWHTACPKAKGAKVLGSVVIIEPDAEFYTAIAGA